MGEKTRAPSDGEEEWAKSGEYSEWTISIAADNEVIMRNNNEL